ncbi:MAG: hypothetical protein ABR906_02745 [Terracidiphilus sp.]|jgi:hypothetical protein
MRKNILAVVFLAICPLAFAQQTLNNDSIIKLVKAGLSDDLIVTTINAQPGSFDVSTDGLIALKSAGASDKVVAAIVLKAASAPTPPPTPPVPPSPTAAAPAAATPAADASTPAAPAAAPTAPTPPAAPAAIPAAAPIPAASAPALPPGIDEVGVYSLDKSGAWTLIAPEFAIAKYGGVAVGDEKLGATKGHIANVKARLGASFPITLAVYVPEGGSIANYRLLRLQAKTGEREFHISSSKASKDNNDLDKDSVVFSSEKIAPRVYQITLTSSLGVGEYGILPPKGADTAANSWKIYCFSVGD